MTASNWDSLICPLSSWLHLGCGLCFREAGASLVLGEAVSASAAATDVVRASCRLQQVFAAGYQVG